MLSLLMFAAPAEAQFGNAFRQFFGQTVDTVYDVDQQDIEEALPEAVGRVIYVILGFVSVILLVIIIFSGFLWLTAGGNTDQVEKAKKYLRNGVIGFVLVLAAFVITSFVVNILLGALA